VTGAGAFRNRHLGDVVFRLGLAVTMMDPLPAVGELIPTGTGVTEAFTVQASDLGGGHPRYWMSAVL